MSLAAGRRAKEATVCDNLQGNILTGLDDAEKALLMTMAYCLRATAQPFRRGLRGTFESLLRGWLAGLQSGDIPRAT